MCEKCTFAIAEICISVMTGKMKQHEGYSGGNSEN